MAEQLDLYLAKSNRCLICASNRLLPAFQVYYWRENLLDYFDCQECGATFANPMPSDELISQGNTALVRFYQQGRTFDQEFRDARQAYLRGKIFARKLSCFKRKGRLLELGCYQGFFSLGVKENSDWEVAGLEISRDLAAFIEEKLRLKCYLGTLEAADLPANHFDFVLCHDLIEHINRPQVFLRKLASVLAPGGRVQIITPNGLQDLAYTRRSNVAGMPPTMLLNHILYFRTGTLRRALEGVGLSVRKIHGYDIRHAMKDFGVFGMGKPVSGGQAPLMQEALQLTEQSMLSSWTADRVNELKSHPKTSWSYGLVKEILPRALTIKVPARLELGHEIYALAEKP